jgi:hypothetical protein
MDFKVDIGKNIITGDIAKEIKLLDQVPTQAYGYFKAITPIKSGNARRNTHLTKDTIHAQYAYADRLDNGSSRQAPSGMSKPTEAFIKKTVDKIIRKK